MTAESASAIISGLALIFTGWGLWSTRKDSVKMQSQIDSLANLAEINHRTRRDDIMPNFVIDRILLNQHGLFISVRNEKIPAYDIEFTIITLNQNFQISFNNKLRIMSFNQSHDVHIELQNGLFNFDIVRAYVSLTISFKNKDGEKFIQITEARESGVSVSDLSAFPPLFQVE